MAVVFIAIACSRVDDNTIYLKAFSDTYGIARWFYPGDEAQDVDWNVLALDGVRKIGQAGSADEFRNVMQNIFYPFAPGIVFSGDPDYDIRNIMPDDTAGMKQIAWQHYGVDLGKWSNSYVSKRTCRDFDSEGINRLAVEIALPATDYIGKDLTLSIDMDNNTPPSLEVYAKISLDLNSPEDYINFCDFNQDHVISREFKERLSVDGDDSNKLIRIGIYTSGDGEFVIRKCILSASGRPLDLLAYPFIKNETVYDYASCSEGCAVSTKDLLFEEHSNVGDVKTVEIIDGLYAHIPLALYGDSRHTYPLPKDTTLPPCCPASVNAATDREMMLADLIVTWNTIKYFHPYLSDQEKDWDACLLSAFNEVFECEQFSLDPLRRMMANLNDAHFVATSPRESKDYGFLPFTVMKNGNRVIVTKSVDSSIHPGDEIIQADDEKAIERYDRCERLVSGSPQYKNYIAGQIWSRQYGQEAEVLLMRDGKHINVNINRIERDEFINRLMTGPEIKTSQWINQDTLYLNTRSSSLAEIKDLLKARDNGQTVLIDIRKGSSFLLMGILPYIADKKDMLPFRNGISRIPKVFIPESPVIADTLQDVRIPELKYDNIFITGPMNYSHDEEVVDYALYCGIAKTAGEATAGCNGRINRMPLPSGGYVTFTGTKVFSNLGRQGYYYAKGIPASPCIFN